VAAAVITSAGKVLMIRRSVAEGHLTWQFPAGKLEAGGESAESAAVREAVEETGVTVMPRRVLGERTHPDTGARITYVACSLVGGTARAASSGEVAEVRWATAQEAGELADGAIYEPVRRYLRDVAALIGRGE
jgi:8-oxo-dGTP diphosphatase